MFCMEDVRSNSRDAGDPMAVSFLGLKFLLLLELNVATEDRHTIELPAFCWYILVDLMTGNVLLILDSSASEASS